MHTVFLTSSREFRSGVQSSGHHLPIAARNTKEGSSLPLRRSLCHAHWCGEHGIRTYLSPDEVYLLVYIIVWLADFSTKTVLQQLIGEVRTQHLAGTAGLLSSKASPVQ